MNSVRLMHSKNDSSTALSISLKAVKKSFYASIGEIVFGMEDGTVTIFGLVAGVAITADSSTQVLLAGATGAISSAISMMCGVFLDLQSDHDQERIKNKKRFVQIQNEPEIAADHFLLKLSDAGISQQTISAIQSEIVDDTKKLIVLDSAFDTQDSDTPNSPFVHATWMFISNLLSALTPVIAFAFLPLAQARWISLLMTLALLLLLGFGRAKIGQRAVYPTMIQTVGVAGFAAVGGVVIGQLITRSIS